MSGAVTSAVFAAGLLCGVAPHARGEEKRSGSSAFTNAYKQQYAVLDRTGVDGLVALLRTRVEGIAAGRDKANVTSYRDRMQAFERSFFHGLKMSYCPKAPTRGIMDLLGGRVREASVQAKFAIPPRESGRIAAIAARLAERGGGRWCESVRLDDLLP